MTGPTSLSELTRYRHARRDRRDAVSLSNLQRQVLHATGDVGGPSRRPDDGAYAVTVCPSWSSSSGGGGWMSSGTAWQHFGRLKQDDYLIACQSLPP